MNGRTYDPMLGRMMQADPFIQAPNNSQSYNRYSYVVNNPLSLTDPSGYLFTKPFKKIFRNVIRASSKIFGAEVTNVLGTIAFSYLGGPLGTAYWTYNFTRAMGGSSSQALKGAFISAASAMVFQQIGQGFNQAYGPFAEATLGQQAAWVGAHALTGGIVSVAQGGKFGHGFLSAGLSKGIMGHFTYADISAPAIMGRTLVAALIGGTVSQVSGGKFGNGAVTAAIAHLMNAEATNYRRKIAHWRAAEKAVELRLRKAGYTIVTGRVSAEYDYDWYVRGREFDVVAFKDVDGVRQWELVEVKYTAKNQFFEIAQKRVPLAKVGRVAQLLTITRQIVFDRHIVNPGVTLTGKNIPGGSVNLQPDSFNVSWEFVHKSGKGVNIGVSESEEFAGAVKGLVGG